MNTKFGVNRISNIFATDTIVSVQLTLLFDSQQLDFVFADKSNSKDIEGHGESGNFVIGPRIISGRLNLTVLFQYLGRSQYLGVKVSDRVTVKSKYVPTHPYTVTANLGNVDFAVCAAGSDPPLWGTCVRAIAAVRVRALFGVHLRL